MIFGIGNEYQHVHSDLYKLNNDFSGVHVKRRLHVGCYAVNRPQNRGEFVNKLVIISAGENNYFFCSGILMS